MEHFSHHPPDIVIRLRRYRMYDYGELHEISVLNEAANEIERLRAALDEAREAARWAYDQGLVPQGLARERWPWLADGK